MIMTVSYSPILMLHISFSCLIAVARPPARWIEVVIKIHRTCLIPDFMGIIFNNYEYDVSSPVFFNKISLLLQGRGSMR